MALTTHLGVPTQNSATTTVMPKLAYRFRVTFDGDAFNNLATTHVIAASRPQLSHDPIQIDAYNSKIYLAGKHTWSPVNITFRDDVDSVLMKQINHQMNRQIDHANQSGIKAGAGYKFGMKVETLDGGNPSPNALDTYTLAGCYITQVGYGDLNYAQSDQIAMTITVQYDNCEIHDATGNVTLSGKPQNTDAINSSGTAIDV
jgi:hypothetical protein